VAQRVSVTLGQHSANSQNCLSEYNLFMTSFTNSAIAEIYNDWHPQCHVSWCCAEWTSNNLWQYSMAFTRTQSQTTDRLLHTEAV